jgi:hypothetical protein
VSYPAAEGTNVSQTQLTADHHTITVYSKGGGLAFSKMFVTSGDGNFRCATRETPVFSAWVDVWLARLPSITHGLKTPTRTSYFISPPVP